MLGEGPGRTAALLEEVPAERAGCAALLGEPAEELLFLERKRSMMARMARSGGPRPDMEICNSYTMEPVDFFERKWLVKGGLCGHASFDSTQASVDS